MGSRFGLLVNVPTRSRLLAMPVETHGADDTGSPLQPLHPRRAASRVARQMLVAFLFTFIAARVLVYLIMSRTIPDLYLHIGGTHVHHLNYGIFLMTGVGAMLLFFSPVGRWLTALTFLYGIALGLTFDEFGMWIHLGGGYWQRASYDAIVVIAGVLGLIAVVPTIKRLRPVHLTVAMLLTIAVGVFWTTLYRSFTYAKQGFEQRVERLDRTGPE